MATFWVSADHTKVIVDAEDNPVYSTAEPKPLGEESRTKIVASDASANSYFGASASIDGDYAIVGADRESTLADRTGAAYIYHRTARNTWDAGTKIVANDAQALDQFGYSSDISGDYAIVGAWLEDAGGSSAGAAYIYHRTGTNTWDAGTKIVASDASANSYFGISVAISGDYAIVGSYLHDSDGAAYIYHRTGTNTWDAGTKIVANDAQASDLFGISVAINGDYAVVGATGEDTGGSGAGAAYIYHRTATNTWDSGIKIVASDAQAGDKFGSSVAIDGDYAVVGAENEGAGGVDSGAAYIYHRTDTNTWDSGVKIVASDAHSNDEFGASADISGDYVVVGAPYESALGDENTGAIYIYHRTDTNTWDSGHKFVLSTPTDGDYYGVGVGISGNYVISSANGDDEGGSSAGAAYILQ